MQGLLALLLLGLEEARDAVLGEARGECGPPEVPAQDITPDALHHAALVAQADAMSAAAQVRAAVFSDYLPYLPARCYHSASPCLLDRSSEHSLQVHELQGPVSCAKNCEGPDARCLL